MYVIMMKTRQAEYRVAKNMSRYFGEKIIPLFEVLNDEYIPRYKTDPITGKFLYEIKDDNKRQSRIRLPDKEEDRITLQKINTSISEKKAFIDFHRFGSKTSPSHLNEEYSTLPLQLAGNYHLYAERLQEVIKYPNLIPVVSIMKKPDDSRSEALKLIQNFKEGGHPIAVRISIAKFEEYEKRLTECLQDVDFLMIDIDRQKVSSLEPSLEMIRQSKAKGTRVLLNSPRNPDLANGEYEEEGYTDQMDCSVCSEYLRIGFAGFGDFGGLKNILPAKSGGKGGSALALLYDRNENKFLSIRNTDSLIGVRGYSDVIARIMQRKTEIDPDRDCPAMEIIDRLIQEKKSGNWQTWIDITLTRSIHQQYKRSG